MPQLYYPKPYVFTDAKRDKEYRGPGSFEVADDAEEQYLKRGWLRSPPDDATAADDETVHEASARPAEGPDDADADAESEAEPEPEANPEPTSETEPHPPAEDDPEPETGDTGGDDEPVTTEEAADEDQVEYHTLTISELREVLDANAASMSDERLRELIKHEKDTKNRKGALRALRSHLDDDADDASDEE